MKHITYTVLYCFTQYVTVDGLINEHTVDMWIQGYLSANARVALLAMRAMGDD
jgi:hypothetical protein